MEEHEIDYVERLKKEITDLTEQLTRYKIRTEILTKKAQINLIMMMEREFPSKEINLNDYMEYRPLSAMDIVDTLGVNFFDLKLQVESHNEKVKRLSAEAEQKEEANEKV